MRLRSISANSTQTLPAPLKSQSYQLQLVSGLLLQSVRLATLAIALAAIGLRLPPNSAQLTQCPAANNPTSHKDVELAPTLGQSDRLAPVPAIGLAPLPRIAHPGEYPARVSQSAISLSSTPENGIRGVARVIAPFHTPARHPKSLGRLPHANDSSTSSLFPAVPGHRAELG